MAKKDLRAQMDAARAAAAFIGAAQESTAHEEPARSKHQDEAASSEEVKGEPPLEDAADVFDYFTLEDALNASSMGTAVRSSDLKRSVAASAGIEEVKGAQSAAKRRAAGKSSAAAAHDAESHPSTPVTAPSVPDILPEPVEAVAAVADLVVDDAPTKASAAPAKASRAAKATDKPKAPRAKRGRKKAAPADEALEVEASGSRMTAQVLVPMTAEQREHADLLAQVMKITRAEVMRQALDEYWENHRSELQAAVAAYEALIRKLMS